jgi:hypothetical protein
MIAIVSHDAGGAEILSSWVRRCTEPYRLVLEGPAKGIFERKLGICCTVSLSEAIKQSDWVLCGTSWQSNLERQAITQARAAEKRVAAFLDHWVNYKERFQEQGVAVYPDEIWVGDAEAERIAHSCFSEQRIVLKSNPYFDDLQHELDNVQTAPHSHTGYSVLYVCEPIREHTLLAYGDERYWGYTEEEALQYFIQNISAIRRAVSKVKIRPHPSENKDKYDWAKQTSIPTIEIGGGETLLEETAAANVVVGCESMAMVVGLMAKKRVISSIPPGGKPCSLPHPEIEHMQLLVRDCQRSPHD